MRIWVTGVGVISPLARGAAATMDRLLEGARAQRPIELFSLPPNGVRPASVAEVSGITPDLGAPLGRAEERSRSSVMSILAAREALAQAGVLPAKMPVDLILGGTTAGMLENEDALAAFSRDPASVRPLPSMIAHPLSAMADHMHEDLGPFRRVRTLCSACSSGANAVLLAAAWILAGEARCVLAGGADGLCRLTLAGFTALSALSNEPCRPFDRARAGLNLGEGAALLVLEPELAARARGARPIAELRGFGIGAEAHHITNPEPSGETAARVMREALARGGVSPKDLDYINAHGTATPLNDAMERAAIIVALGAESRRVAVSSSKGQIGHTLAAAGAIEAAITAMAIERGTLPPTVGLEAPDAPEAPGAEGAEGAEGPEGRALALVTTSRRASVRAALSNSFGFGGTDAALLFTAPGAFPDLKPKPRYGVVVTGAATVGPLGVLSAEGSLAYLDEGPPPPPGKLELAFADHLDVGRIRRMDRIGKLTTLAIAAAQSDARLPLFTREAREAREAQGEGASGASRDAPDAIATGAIGGSAFGSVDGSIAFIQRLYDKGVKFASPADFPNLVPSSPIGHASIYLGLRGPVLSVSDLDVTAECAAVTAIELVSAGVGEALFAGSAEESSAMIDRFFGPICCGVTDRGPRSEGAAFALFEAEEHARARSARVLARVLWWSSWRDDASLALDAVPLPLPSSEVFCARDDARVARALKGSPWGLVPRRAAAPRAGDHEGTGGIAAVLAVARVASSTSPPASALLLGIGKDRGYAILFGPDESEPTG